MAPLVADPRSYLKTPCVSRSWVAAPAGRRSAPDEGNHDQSVGARLAVLMVTA